MQKLRFWTLIALGALNAAWAGPALASPYPVTPNIASAFFAALPNPAAVPSGANVFPCKSSVDPYPVVLVNGTFSVMKVAFSGLAPDLANAGYCVYGFNYGGANSTDLIQAVGPVSKSAEQLAYFIAAVQQVTGAAKVDLVGWSQGGLLVEYYAKVLGGAANIHSFVGLAPPTHGTTLEGLTGLAGVFPGANQLVSGFCPACADQEAGSSLVRTLNAGPIAQYGISYTIIETTNETVVTPVGSSFINEPNVRNEYVQQYCPFDFVDHVDLPYDNVVTQLVKNALVPSLAKAPNCFSEFPFPAQ